MARGASHYETVTRRDLSPRQREVLELIAAGRTNGEIARQLGISLDGAKWHVSEILTKLSVPSREAAAEWWASNGGRATRFANIARALGSLGPWKVAASVAGVVAVGAITAIILAARGDDVPRSPAVGRCTVDDAIIDPVEVRGPDQDVLFALTARSRERPCHFEGAILGSIQAPKSITLEGVSVSDIDVRLTPQRTTLAYLMWSNWCGDRSQPASLDASLFSKGQSQPLIVGGLRYIVQRPPCNPGPSSPPQVMKLTLSAFSGALSSFIPDLGPDPLDDAIACYAFTDPKWQKPCEVTGRIQLPGLNTGDVSSIFLSVELTDYICPEPGTGGIGGPSILCEGALAGEVRKGIPVAFHGSAGDVLSVEQLRAALEAMIATAKGSQLFATRVATVACLDVACHEFALGIANDGSPAAAYLLFRVDGDQPKLTGAGFAGDVALEIRRGGKVRAGRDMDFIPLIPPY